MVIFRTRKRGFIRGSDPTWHPNPVVWKPPKHTNALVWYLLKPVFVGAFTTGLGAFWKAATWPGPGKSSCTMTFGMWLPFSLFLSHSRAPRIAGPHPPFFFCPPARPTKQPFHLNCLTRTVYKWQLTGSVVPVVCQSMTDLCLNDIS